MEFVNFKMFAFSICFKTILIVLKFFYLWNRILAFYVREVLLVEFLIAHLGTGSLQVFGDRIPYNCEIEFYPPVSSQV